MERYEITVLVEVDEDHPGIDSTGSAMDILKDTMKKNLYEDSYLTVLDVEVEQI